MLDLEGIGIPKQMSEELSVTKKKTENITTSFIKQKLPRAHYWIFVTPPTPKKIHKLESYPQCNGIWTWAFERSLGPESGVLMIELAPL